MLTLILLVYRFAFPNYFLFFHISQVLVLIAVFIFVFDQES